MTHSEFFLTSEPVTVLAKAIREGFVQVRKSGLPYSFS